MATADELLAGSMAKVEQVLNIDWEKRTIDIPKMITNIGVEYDDDTKHLKFRAPRYYHGVDLSELRVAIGYWNADDEPDVYYPEDITVDDSTLMFTWVVGPHAYTKSGDVTFLVYIRKGETGDDDVHTKRVGTTLHALPVLKGGNPDQAFAEQHYDALTAAVLEGLQMAQDTDLKGEPGHTPVKGTDYYTEQERNDFVDLIVRDHNGIFANALKDTVSGSVIRVDDVSPIEHTVKTRVGGKNLIPPGYKTIASGVTRNDDGSVHFKSDGVTTGYHETRIVNIGDDTLYLEPGKYSFKLIGAPIGVHFVIGGGCATYTESPSGTLTVERAGYIDYIIVRFAKGYEYDCTVYPMLVKGDVIPTEYEPYIDPTSVSVFGLGKNLFNLDKYMLTYPDRLKRHSDNSFTITSNVANNSFANLSIPIPGNLEGQTITVSGKWIVSGQNKASLRVQWYDSDQKGYVNPIVALVSTSGTSATGVVPVKPGVNCELRLLIYFNTDGTLSIGDTVTYTDVQIEVGNTVTSWEPYTAAEYTPAVDGSVNIVSVSPTMTLCTDTPGVTIEAEYSVDIQKRFFSLVTEERIKNAVAAWLDDHYAEAEGASF